MTRAPSASHTADPGLPRAVATLCVTEVVSWGVLFYAFPVLSSSISADEGWPMVWLVAAFTLALVVSGGCGVWVGRRIDHVGPRAVMTAGSALAVASVAALAAAPTLPSFFAAWVMAGAAMSATLYAPAFAAVTGWSADDPVRRVRSLTAITLVAGLASTVFAPLAALLLTALGWRGTYLTLALVLLTTVPLHAWGLRPRWTSTRTRDTARTDEGGSPVPPQDFDPRAFTLLVVAMALAGFAVHAVVINLVPLLTAHGLTTTQAAVALGAGGLGQVVGRLFYSPLLSRTGPTSRAVTTIAGVAATTGALAVWQSPFALVCLVAFSSGTVRGIFTLVQATAVVDRWGVGDIGHRNGILTGAITVVSAFAPWVGALLAALLGSYDVTFALLAGLAAAAAWLISRTGPSAQPSGARRGTPGHTASMAKFASVDDYLASLPVEQRAVVEEIERRVLLVVPGADRVIRYDMPTWQVDGASLVHAAAWKQHVSLYPVPPAGDADLDAALEPYAGAKGTLKLPYAEVDYALVERVVRRLLETRASD